MSVGLPSIPTTDRPLRDVSDAALAALVAANTGEPRLFTRTGAIARVRVSEDGRPLIDTVDDAILRRELSRAADFTRRGNHGHERAVAPPVEVVRDLRVHPEPPFPPLLGVIESPALRPDGTVLRAPGYDSATKLVHLPARGLEVPAVDDRPTGQAVKEAVALIVGDYLGDFPFEGQASAAAAVALALTPIVRPAIEGNVPLAVLDATKAGTGKGLLASTAALIGTGRPAAVLAAPTREEEWQKVIGAQVLGGSTFNLFDEVRELASPALSAALTSRVLEARILGRSESVRVPQRSTWVAAGNNVQIGGDMARRSYRVRLDAGVSRPWRRNGWRHPDLEGWVATNRGRLLWALLTIARAYFAAGRPKADVAPLGGFDEWAQTVGGILAVAGIDGFLADLDDFYEDADQESTAWENFLVRVLGALGPDPWLVGDLARAVAADDVLRDLIPDEELATKLDKSPRSFGSAMGKALRQRNGTRFGERGVRVCKAGEDPRSGSARWRVEVDPAEVAV